MRYGAALRDSIATFRGLIHHHNMHFRLGKRGLGGTSVHEPGTIRGALLPRKMPWAKTSTGNIEKVVLRDRANGIA